MSDGYPRLRTERFDELLERKDVEDLGGTYEGIVGWGDGGAHFEAGDGDENDGHTLVKVTLIEGAPRKRSLEGRKVLCRVATGMNMVSSNGKHVVVLIPAGMSGTPGGPVILCQVGPNPKTLPGQKADEIVLQGPGQNFIRLDGKGGISLFTTDDGTEQGRSVSLQVRKDGFRLVHPHIKCTFDGTGFHVLHSSGARIDLGAISGMPAPLDALSSYVKVSAAMLQLEASAVSIGAPDGTAQPIAKAGPTLNLFTSFNNTLTVIQAALVAVNALAGTMVPTGATGAAATAAGTALTALTTAMLALLGRSRRLKQRSPRALEW